MAGKIEMTSKPELKSGGGKKERPKLRGKSRGRR